MPRTAEGFLTPELKWLKYDLATIRTDVPREPGIYLLGYGAGPRVVYVGKATRSLRGRLLTYGSPHCHNRWIRTYFHAKGVATAFGAVPDDLQFMFRRSDHPDVAEGVAIQRYRTALDGFNQRNEWQPLGNTQDVAYRRFIAHLKATLPADQAGTLLAQLSTQQDDSIELLGEQW